MKPTIAQPIPDYRIAEHTAHQAIDADSGEYFFHYVTTNRPNYQAEVDPQIEPQQVLVVFTWESNDQRMGLAEERIDSRDPCIIADRYRFRRTPKRLDRFVRCLDRTAWEVTKVHPDGLSGLRIELVQLGTPY